MKKYTASTQRRWFATGYRKEAASRPLGAARGVGAGVQLDHLSFSEEDFGRIREQVENSPHFDNFIAGQGPTFPLMRVMQRSGWHSRVTRSTIWRISWNLQYKQTSTFLSAFQPSQRQHRHPPNSRASRKHSPNKMWALHQKQHQQHVAHTWEVEAVEVEDPQSKHAAVTAVGGEGIQEGTETVQAAPSLPAPTPTEPVTTTVDGQDVQEGTAAMQAEPSPVPTPPSQPHQSKFRCSLSCKRSRLK